MSNFDVCLAFTLQEEGGYQCVHDDPGNWTGGSCGQGTLVGTCYGISAPVLAAWLSAGSRLTPAVMRALPSEMASAIYGAQYWLPCGGPSLPPGVNLMVFDHAVNCGVRRSVQLLQAAVGVATDGYVGKYTRAAVATMDAAKLIDDLKFRQEDAYRWLPNASQFLTGWLARLQRRQAAAHKLLQESVP